MWNRYYDLQWNLTKSILFNYSATMNAIIDEPLGDIIVDKDEALTKANKDSIKTNLRNFGRAKNFSQDMRLTYRVPLDKMPILDWISADAKYGTSFNYQAMAYNLNDDDTGNNNGNLFGNTIRNGRIEA